MVVLQLLILLKLFTDCHLVQISFITRFPSQLLHVLIEIDVPSKLVQMDIFLAVAQNKLVFSILYIPLQCAFPGSWVHWTMRLTSATYSFSSWSFPLEEEGVQCAVLLGECRKQASKGPVSSSFISVCCRHLHYVMLLWVYQLHSKIRCLSLYCNWKLFHNFLERLESFRFQAQFFCFIFAFLIFCVHGSWS